MGRACSVHGTREMNPKCSLEGLKGRDHSEQPSVDGKIILKWIFL
jgi:hypothetical protein